MGLTEALTPLTRARRLSHGLRHMRRVQLVVGWLGAFVVFAAVGFGLFLVGRALYSGLSAAPSAFTTALIGALGVAVGGLGAIAYQRRGAVEDSLREARTPVYEDFMSFFFRLFASAKRPELKPDEAEMEKFFMDFTRRAIPLSSDRFLTEWSAYRVKLVRGELQTTDATKPNHTLVDFERVLLAVRHDFGHRDRHLHPGDILGMWINDLPTMPQKYPKS